MRTKALFTIVAIVGALATHADPAHAQRRRGRRHEPSGSSAPSGTSSGGTEQPASGSTGGASSGATQQRAPEPPPPPPHTTGTRANTPPPGTSTRNNAAPRSNAGAPAGRAGNAQANNQVLVSGVVNHPGQHQTRVHVEIFGGVGPGAWAWPWGGFLLSPGLRLGIPLTRNGFVANLNNDVHLMIGAQVYFSITPIPYWWLSAPVTLQWNFYLSEQWSVLLEAGLAVDVFLYDLINCYDHPRLYCDRVYFHPAGAIGLRRHLSGPAQPGYPSIAFRFTYPAGVQVALEF